MTQAKEKPVQETPVQPKWFNSKGGKMSVRNVDPVKLEMSISDMRASLMINVVYIVNRPHFVCEWQVKFDFGEWAGGRVMLTEEMFASAFKLDEGQANAPEELLGAIKWEKVLFPAETLWPNRFIRSGRFLNMPIPSNGCERHPSISILLSDKIIKEAVKLRQYAAAKTLVRKA